MSGTPLHYEHRSVTATRRWKCRVILAAILMTVAVLTYLRGPALYHRAQLLYWQRQCLNYTVAPGTKVFEGKTRRGTGAIAVLDQFFGLAGLRLVNDPVIQRVFVHERVSPGGRRRLVIVKVIIARVNDMDCELIEPGTWLREPSPIPNSGGFVRLPDYIQAIHAGQADPIDRSHFTIDIATESATLTYDGWLCDDDTVRLEPRAPTASPTPATVPAMSP